MDAYIEQVVDYLLSQSWQIAILTAVVALVTFLLRNRSAHIRYLLWLVVLAKCLVPPMYALPLRVLPQDVLVISMSEPESSEQGSDAVAAGANDPSIPQASAAPVEGLSNSGLSRNNLGPGDSQTLPPPAEGPPTFAETDTREGWKLTWADARFWSGITWLTGVCAYLAVNALKALSTHRWLRRERRPLQADLQARISEFFLARGFRRLPNMWLVADVNQPFVWGLLRGSVYVPPDLLND
ncbi:MAG: M56 family metallopeptidase, partial [Planctomycetota bacterium]